MKTRSRTFIATAAAIAGTSLLAPGIAGADPVFSGTVDGQQLINGADAVMGQAVSLTGTDCFNPESGEPAYMGEYLTMTEDPWTAPSPDKGYEADVTETDGSFQWDMMLGEDSTMGTFYVRWYCSTAPATSIDDPAIMWMGPLWTFTINGAPGDARSADASRGGSARVTVDPDALPAVDEIGITGDKAADLKAVVDARSASVATAQRLYSAFLGRTADSAGLSYWTGQIDKGVSLRTLAARFANTAEFKNGRGELSDSAFVDAMYRSILGRAADASGRAFWLDRLGSGASRADVVTSFANSRENVAKTANFNYVVTAYHVLTGSVPSKAEVNEQAKKLDEGQLKVTVVEDVALTAKSADQWMQAG